MFNWLLDNGTKANADVVINATIIIDNNFFITILPSVKICSCLIYQAAKPNKLGDYIGKDKALPFTSSPVAKTLSVS